MITDELREAYKQNHLVADLCAKIPPTVPAPAMPDPALLEYREREEHSED